VAPISTLDDAGVTDIDATGGGVDVVTERGAVPVAAPLVAAIMVVPAARAVIIPELTMVATVTLLELQTTAVPVSTLLVESRVVSIAWIV